MPKLDLIGTRRLNLLVVEEVVAALRFAVERQFDRDMFSKFPRQFENLAGVAALEFQFDFADGSGSASRFLRTGPIVRRTLVSKTGMSLCFSFLVSSGSSAVP